ncbi:MAG: DUF721 domain-containing protein [Bacteroidales bacterium]|jgi:predicted nucleic acid-binding Zn ribbon protein|nr:DUF721 domain-containing protein [Bacteroidales bacterium]
MRKTNTQSLGEVLKEALKNQHLDEKLNEQRLISAWKELLGPGVTQYTTQLYIRNKVLNVSLSSAILRAELMMSRERLVQSLNEHVGTTVIIDIIFR